MEKVGGANFFYQFLDSQEASRKMVKILEKAGPTNFSRTSGSEKVGGANFFHQFLDFQEVSRKMVEILEKVGPTNFF